MVKVGRALQHLPYPLVQRGIALPRAARSAPTLPLQKALTLVPEQTERIMAQGPQLDAVGCDMCKRFPFR
ncbi:hypothetical protein [Streptomyces sp. NPDC056296]|uniref:hypothetical protein n=1 Tax=Streptomyces sp. NPDC056296 TaxID=3345775 RepID=UPI0035E32857